jgi:hypothetical protein
MCTAFGYSGLLNSFSSVSALLCPRLSAFGFLPASFQHISTALQAHEIVKARSAALDLWMLIGLS